MLHPYLSRSCLSLPCRPTLSSYATQADVNMDESGPNPNMALAVDITPGVNGIISPYRIRKLFGILDYVTKVCMRMTSAFLSTRKSVCGG